MRINFNAIQPKNTIINAARVNASFAKNNSRTGKSAGTGRSDRVDFSPQGKLMSMIENLSKQKQTIIDRKNELVENTLKNDCMPSRPRHVWNRMTRKRRTGLTLIRRRNSARWSV